MSLVSNLALKVVVGVGVVAGCLLAIQGAVLAQPYGRGVYGANVPYGSQTSLAISVGGNTTIQITPTDTPVQSTGTSSVTVASTDVVGYKLYVKAESSANLVNGPATIPASGNTFASPAALATNTWGYNIDASNSFAGITTSESLVKTITGPKTSGDTTTFTYGVKLDNSKAAGKYTATVTYVAAPMTD